MELISDTLKINRQNIINAFPRELKSDVEVVIEFLFQKDFDFDIGHYQEITLNAEKLFIPKRVYFDEPSGIDDLSNLQKTILNCIYLRHYNGFVRQHSLELLINSMDYFVVPYIFQLLGEYVVEILFVLDKHINNETIDSYLRFIAENKQYWQQTESRVGSYWNEYYRTLPKYKKFSNYIGKQIVERIKKSQSKINS
jgi:hypothetical protein